MAHNTIHTFNGTGSPICIGFGFIPDVVRITKIDTGDYLEWRRGIKTTKRVVAGTLSTLADTAGIVLFAGGNRIESASNANISQAVDLDLRYIDRTNPVTFITVDTAGTFKGHFNAPVDASKVGVGSQVILEGGKVYTIAAMSGNGTAANSVTLDKAFGTAQVEKVGPRFTLQPTPAGTFQPAGILLNEVTLNAANTALLLEVEHGSVVI